jgi:hypothetical protein
LDKIATDVVSTALIFSHRSKKQKSLLTGNQKGRETSLAPTVGSEACERRPGGLSLSHHRRSFLVHSRRLKRLNPYPQWSVE